MLVACLAYSSSVTMEATCPCETSANFEQTTPRTMLEDITLRRLIMTVEVHSSDTYTETPCEKVSAFLNFKEGGTYSNHKALKGLKRLQRQGECTI
jgi:hypothetical protein